ncbi:group II intron maturase-specific domain-containing protein [Dyella sp. S184]|nr:group II intron maturase-specific domain-containing protein [Dyella sp. S184]
MICFADDDWSVDLAAAMWLPFRGWNTIETLNPVLHGWIGYFKLSDSKIV